MIRTYFCVSDDVMVTFTENGIGDVCENDYDGDSFTNDIDICPRNREIDRADFVVFHQVPLYHKRKPVWRVHPNGLEIVQEKLSSSGIAVGKLLQLMLLIWTERFLSCGITQAITDSQMLTSTAHFL